MQLSRNSFKSMLEDYQTDILRMGNLVEQALDNAVISLAEQDLNLARLVVDSDKKIDALMQALEDHSLKLIARQQPMASDLRHIGTGFKIIQDLERIGDHAVHIAEITLRFGNQPLIKPLEDIPKMGEQTQEMLRLMLQAYVTGDLDLATRVSKMDDIVDTLYSKITMEMIEVMQKDPRTVEQATYLTLAAKYLERVGDHATNIGERLVYRYTGLHQAFNG